MKKSVLSAALLVLVLLSGCSGPEKDAKYESINDFAVAYENGLGDGMECQRTDRDIEDHEWIFTNCGQHTILMLFTSDDKREEILSKNPLESGERWVQGPNWVVQATQFEAEDAQKALGGKLVDSLP